MRIIKLNSETRNRLQENLLKRNPGSYTEYEQSVSEILENVKREKDRALFAYTRQFDHAKIRRRDTDRL